MMRKAIKDIPIILLAGAPRSGTSYLFNLLQQHPTICGHSTNESYFFMNEAHPLRNPTSNFYDHDLFNYRTCFSRPTKQTTYFLDGTDHLMFQEEMIPVIGRLPNVKMIFILREPAARILSSFEFTKYNLMNFSEDVNFTDYMESLLEENTELINQWLPRNKGSQYILQRELEYSHYHNFIQQWLTLIPDTNIYIIQFETFIKQVDQTLIDLFKWLDIKEEYFINKENYRNASINITYTFLHKIANQLKSVFPNSKLRDHLKASYLAFQKKEKNRTPETLKALEKLKLVYQESNESLAKYANIDLSLWV